MKKIIYTIIVMSLLTACTGEKGDVGPQGDQGTKGAVGVAGQVGGQGATGDKGPTGAAGGQGAAGSQGSTPAASVTSSDWTDLGAWDNSSSSAIFYYMYKTTSKNITLSLIPNSDKLSLSTFSTLGSYSVNHTVTKEVVGTLYVFYSLLTPENEQVIFSEDFENGTFSAFDSSISGLFDIDANLKTTPRIAQQLNISFAESKYKPADNLKTVLQNMKAKVRHIYVPLGIPSKNGRKAADIKTYQELIEAYNIPL